MSGHQEPNVTTPLNTERVQEAQPEAEVSGSLTTLVPPSDQHISSIASGVRSVAAAAGSSAVAGAGTTQNVAPEAMRARAEVDARSRAAIQARPRAPGGGTSEISSLNSKISAASAVVQDDELWGKWVNNHNVIVEEDNWANINFQRMMNDFKYPDCIKNPQFIKVFSDLGSDTFASWVEKLPTEPMDRSKLYIFGSCLAAHWKSHILACKIGEKEAGKRRGVDCLIENAFCLRTGGAHLYRVEASLALPISKDKSPSPYEAKADAITTQSLPRDWAEPNFVNSWSPLAKVRRLDPMSFAYEAKFFENGLRQLIMYFATGQHHRRALGLNDIPIFGVTLENSKFTLYVSFWEDDKLIVHPAGFSWNLERVEEFVTCYIQLCILADHISFIHQNSVKESDEHKAALQSKAAQNPWRDYRRDRDSKAGSKKRKYSHDGDGSDAYQSGGVDGAVQEQDSGALLVESQSIIDDILGGKVPWMKTYPLTQVNIRAHEPLAEHFDLSPSPTDKIKKWVDDITASKRESKRARDSDATPIHLTSYPAHIKKQMGNIAARKHKSGVIPAGVRHSVRCTLISKAISPTCKQVAQS